MCTCHRPHMRRQQLLPYAHMYIQIHTDTLSEATGSTRRHPVARPGRPHGHCRAHVGALSKRKTTILKPLRGLVPHPSGTTPRTASGLREAEVEPIVMQNHPWGGLPGAPAAIRKFGSGGHMASAWLSWSVFPLENGQSEGLGELRVPPV